VAQDHARVPPPRRTRPDSLALTDSPSARSDHRQGFVLRGVRSVEGLSRSSGLGRDRSDGPPEGLAYAMRPAGEQDKP